MRILTLIVPTFLGSLCGCASYSTILTNPEGKTITCNSNGFGIIGTVVATSRFNDCVKIAKDKGYKE